ncbi:MAG TPA: ABC transporter permease [Salinimicrobium sp.]|nr:ABC transporter permease [Salinimicrobium sp.]
MIRNYIKIAWRNLKTDSTFSIVNILGLSIGLAITLLLFLFVVHERSFDDMYANKKNIYRVLLHTTDERQEIWPSVPAALAPAVENTIPEIKKAARMLKHDFGAPAFITANESDFIENGLYFTDPEFIDIFEISFVSGNPDLALSRPNTAVLSQSTAERFFGDENPLGKTLTLDNNKKLEITGVFEDFPENSTLDANLLASFSSTGFYNNPRWGNASFETYFLLNDNADIALTEQKIQQLLNSKVDKENQWYSFSLQPLERVHLYSANFTDSYSSRRGDIKSVRNLSLLAILILLIACINYMNLTTARSQKRTKDVGINKTLGASSKNLILRFYTETGLITCIAVIIGVVLAVLAIPAFNTVAGKNLSTDLLLSSGFLISLLLIWLITTLLAGSYPAFYLSRFSPKSVMKPSFQKGGTATFIRKGLVVLQFSASVILIISVLVIHKQLTFIQNKNLGYNPENVIAIATAGIQNENNATALANEFKALPSVSEVSFAQGFPGVEVSGRTLYKKNSDNGISIQTNHTDAGIIEVLKLELLAGKTLPKTKAEGDTLVEVILNKKAVDYLGYTPREAIGKKVELNLGNSYIVGVVDNFNFSSLHVPIGAYAFSNSPREPVRCLLVRFNTGILPQTMAKFEETFKEVVPDSAFEYRFLDKNLETLYAAEQRTARVGLIFSILAIFVACLGLFGLAAFTAEQRRKEIGVRKVLGASVFNITQLLSKDFILLVLLALVIAFPIALWLMEKWLQDFAYRIELGWLVFLVAGVLAIVIALVTVSFQAIKAAIANPVKSLRTE